MCDFKTNLPDQKLTEVGAEGHRTEALKQKEHVIFDNSSWFPKEMIPLLDMTCDFWWLVQLNPKRN